MSEARKIVFQYMDPDEFQNNLNRVSFGRPVKWSSTPSVEACIRWDNICRRYGVF